MSQLKFNLNKILNQVIHIQGLVSTSNKLTSLFWVSSHVRIPGNEKAYKIAFEASKSQNALKLIPTTYILRNTQHF